MSQSKKYEGTITGFFILLGIVTVIAVPLLLIYFNLMKSFLPTSPDLRTYQTGFLGTNASRAADLTLLGYILILIPLALLGFRYARRHLFAPHHKMVMTTVTLINWGIILYVMAATYAAGVAPRFPQELNKTDIWLPSLHLLTGLTAQLIATVSLIRMWFHYRLPESLRYEPIKPQMRTTLALWVITAVLGVGIYINYYGLPFSKRATTSGNNNQPVATVEATSSAPEGTPAATPAATDAGSPASTPAATQNP